MYVYVDNSINFHIHELPQVILLNARYVDMKITMQHSSKSTVGLIDGHMHFLRLSSLPIAIVQFI